MTDEQIMHEFLSALDKIDPEVLNKTIDAMPMTDEEFVRWRMSLYERAYQVKCLGDEEDMKNLLDEGYELEDEAMNINRTKLVEEMTPLRDFKIITLDDGRKWVTDGIVGYDPHIACKLIGMLKEISCIKGTMTVEGGILWTEDGMSYDLEQSLKNLTK